MSQREKLVTYLRKNVDEEFEPDHSLLDIMDSVSLLQFMIFVEQTLNITINQDDMTIEIFETVDTVIAFFESE